jgi:hypothetical protein
MKRGTGDSSPDGVLGVPPIFFNFPHDWGIQGVDQALSKGLKDFI